MHQGFSKITDPATRQELPYPLSSPTQSLEVKMLRPLFAKSTGKHAILSFVQFNPHREMHSRNKKAMELIAKGWSALKEVDRVIDYCERNDKRLIPLLRAAKENFELALEADNSNTHARYWLSKLHLKYHVPGACKAIGAALLVEAADMGDPDAQYELGCRLRIEVQVPECLTKLSSKRGSAAKRARKNVESLSSDPAEMAKEQFQVAAQAGCDLGLKWLQRLEEEEKRLLRESSSTDNVSQAKPAFL
ncbi:Binding, putative isoform 2 [Theobroma cacao]|uniref:Binding, putative isoform 2 n=1 Tax=Theobroma cacao TaxID=3641 RepID=A0A061GPD9_THECC|nr:Binding, putative isoform 2 [Theobroma cacao]